MSGPHTIELLGIPADAGGSSVGCLMGPDSMRTAGMVDVISELGHQVIDRGNMAYAPANVTPHENKAVRNLDDYVGLTTAIDSYCKENLQADVMPIFMGGDHAIAAGILPAMARRAANKDKPFFLLWLDAHPDIHDLNSTTSGNLHGTPMAYSLGRSGFEGALPTCPQKLDPENICMLGIRSVDPDERGRLADTPIDVHDMRAIDEFGVAKPIRDFLERVAEAGGDLHVSLDVDFLDPEIAPAVGTTVPGGASFREAHLIMELLNDSGLVTSLDIVELNPFLDVRGRTAQLMVDLTASLLGRRVLDRPTSRY